MILQIISFPKFCINGNCFFYNFNHTKINQDSENEILWKYVVTRHIKKRDFKFKILKNTYSCCGPKNKHSLLGFVGFIPFFVFQSNWPKPKKSAVIFRQNKQDSWFFCFWSLWTKNEKWNEPNICYWKCSKTKVCIIWKKYYIPRYDFS